MKMNCPRHEERYMSLICDVSTAWKCCRHKMSATLHIVSSLLAGALAITDILSKIGEDWWSWSVRSYATKASLVPYRRSGRFIGASMVFLMMYLCTQRWMQSSLHRSGCRIDFEPQHDSKKTNGKGSVNSSNTQTHFYRFIVHIKRRKFTTCLEEELSFLEKLVKQTKRRCVLWIYHLSIKCSL